MANGSEGVLNGSEKRVNDDGRPRSNELDATYCGCPEALPLTDLQIARIADDIGVRLIDDPRLPDDEEDADE